MKSSSPSTTCTRIRILKDADNKVVDVSTTTSGKCSDKSKFICSLNASKFTSPPISTKFPCIPKNTKERVKRSGVGSDSTAEENKKGYYFVK